MGLGTIIARGVAAVWVGICASATLAAGGGALNDPQEIYTNERAGMPGDGVGASVTIQFVAYALNSVGGKYKLIPVRVRVGERQAPLALSIEQDRLLVASGGKKIVASFQLSALDRPLWDSLSPDLKKRLTYPEQLSPNSAAVVYAFVPLADLPGPIEGFEYTIKSLPAPLVLAPEAKKAAAMLPADAPQG
ncbi:hypothetical protein [Ideonella sp.]|uniref:hypothetical protein n=1 Tax=Ideonella sp. TaxID=1929293 RepID=UPI002B468653|nr:hypothetical protein [Ideonella sp.]HJV68080.1 hypothetical protein [Ideonella sp.]